MRAASYLQLIKNLGKRSNNAHVQALDLAHTLTIHGSISRLDCQGGRSLRINGADDVAPLPDNGPCKVHGEVDLDSLVAITAITTKLLDREGT